MRREALYFCWARRQDIYDETHYTTTLFVYSIYNITPSDTSGELGLLRIFHYTVTVVEEHTGGWVHGCIPQA